ncbi:beta-glucosidase [Diplocarpon rosae]|nr:beta-glucosidase [Diplocarpon rosae]
MELDMELDMPLPLRRTVIAKLPSTLPSRAKESVSTSRLVAFKVSMSANPSRSDVISLLGLGDVVTTANQTNYVVLCPLTSSPSMIPSSTYAAPVESVSTYEASVFKSSPTYEAPVVKSTSTYEAPVVVPTSSPAKASKPKPSTTPYATPSSGELGTSGKPWAITYSPYQDNGQCKDSGSVASDIAIIAKAGFTAVRVYSSDCSGLENIGSACETHGLKIILGIFISSTGIAGAGEQLTDIVSWGKWNLVELFVVGNEAVFSGHCSAAELASFILTCKTAMTTGGYNGLITTTETLDVWEKNAAVLCPVVDVVGCNIHPFFNAAIDAEHAGEFAASQLKIVDGLCPGKYGVNLETGWPSQGSCNGLACPTLENQATAIKSIVAAVGGKSVMFSYVNDYWKEPGAFGCEQSWGSIQNFLKI